MAIGKPDKSLLELPDGWVDIVQPIIVPEGLTERQGFRVLSDFCHDWRPLGVRTALTHDLEKSERHYIIRVQGLEINVLAFQEELRHLSFS